MSRHHVEVRQLASDHGAYLNVLEGYGMVGVWGFATGEPSVETRTYLCRKGPHFALVEFETEDVAREWLRENAANWPIAMRLTETTP